VNIFLGLIFRSARWLAVLILLALLGLAALSDPLELPPNPWNGPVYEQGIWHLTGIVEGGVQRRTLFMEALDLVEVRYGQGRLWALAGIQGKDGQYESLVAGSLSRVEVEKAFALPRYVTFTIPGTPRAVQHTDCQYSPSSAESNRCHITRLVEGGRPPVVLDPYDEPTGDLSNVFIQSGLFVPHYRYGFLTWDILPSQIIEPGLEGG
jgi:hypothetical protein